MHDALYKAAKLPVSSSEQLLFDHYYNRLVSENEKYNLTAITDEKDVHIKHFIDSMLIKVFFDTYKIETKQKRLIDIGTGAGFPAIPIKILYPEIEVTGLDSLKKRIAFLEMLKEDLTLKDIQFIHGRAEDYGRDTLYRETYDFAVSRAVAELRMLLEYVMPFVKVGGYFVAYKSLKYAEELENAENALKQMKTRYIETIRIVLPENSGERELMIFQKMENIQKKYPRKAGMPKKNPL
ncbi:16S rRNA (guanine(527)-N(7))-methyltransferase RsmG [Fusibacter paucivorans]|uniref:Ribosomal RNA small subunit methyltransferase G n=1 Tax=Fusibacter paucivorans TaxID=76009 RepID=A0ABS5PPL8_9FIRM|nr:16S rRNA (guanine(527)-N(7))-methyltransferase RsmG [Fusibacter paucivorans]MBS7526531.1 16S rRNA (guanine(527)-N(7))-methyltransferase RsmG [Fusibacter paucivorans]